MIFKIRKEIIYTAAVFSACFIPIKSEAVQLNFTVERITAKNVPGEDNLYAIVNIDNEGNERQGGDTEKPDISPNWVFTKTIDPRGRSSLDIPISVDVFDKDGAFDDDSNKLPDDRVDIDPNTENLPGQEEVRLNLVYNLQSRTLVSGSDVFSRSASGTGRKRPKAYPGTIYFDITSDPINFDFSVEDAIEVVGLNTFRYQYTISNLSNSYDIESFELDFVDPRSTIIPAIQPGESYTLDFLSSELPRNGEARVVFNDPNNTRLPTSVRVPKTTPEGRLIVGLLSFAFLAFKCKRINYKKTNIS